jgi:tellurite resistance protein TerC
MMNLFNYLKIGLAVVLTFVGLKMLLAEIYPIPIGIALGVIGVVLLLSVIASLLWPTQKKA